MILLREQQNPYSKRIVCPKISSADKTEESKGAWLLWLVFRVSVDDLDYRLGQDADEVAFIDPGTFKDSEHRSEQLVYQFSQRY